MDTRCVSRPHTALSRISMGSAMTSLGFVLALFTGCSTCSDASTVIPLDLEQSVRLADVVFAGTVTRIHAENLPDDGIVTRYTFSDLRFGKGSGQGAELVLTILGGEVGGLGSVVDGAPSFEINRRYIVLSASGLGSARDSYLPVIGGSQGVFQVDLDSRTGRSIVKDAEGLTSSIAVSVQNFPPATLVAKPTDATCVNNDGSMLLQGSGGTPPLLTEILCVPTNPQRLLLIAGTRSRGPRSRSLLRPQPGKTPSTERSLER